MRTTVIPFRPRTARPEPDPFLPGEHADLLAQLQTCLPHLPLPELAEALVLVTVELEARGLGIRGVDDALEAVIRSVQRDDGHDAG